MLADGDLLLTVQDSRRETVQDVIVLLDRDFGRILRVWDLNESIPRNYSLMYDEDEIDWAHVNAVTFDSRDNGLVVSAQRRGVFKVSWDNELVWILSDERGWDTWRDFLLETDFGSTWGQHDVQYLSASQTFILFDNGLGRGYGNMRRFSRGIEFSVDDQEKTASLVREHGSDRPEYFSPIISGIDSGPGDELLINFGALGYLFSYQDSLNWRGQVAKTDPPLGAAWIEFGSDGEPLLEMSFSYVGPDSGVDQGMYRARYFDIFKAMR